MSRNNLFETGDMSEPNPAVLHMLRKADEALEGERRVRGVRESVLGGRSRDFMNADIVAGKRRGPKHPAIEKLDGERRVEKLYKSMGQTPPDRSDEEG